VRRLLVLVWLVACRPSTPVQPFDLRVAVTGRLEALSPRSGVENWTTIANLLVFEPLIVLNDRGDIVPVLAAGAESVGTSGLRIWMREGATFSDGSPVRFDDIVRSLAGSHLQATQQSDRSILVLSDDPSIPVELQLSFTYIHRPSHKGELGTGPFVLAEEDAEHIVLRRRSPSPGHVGSITILSYKTSQEAFAHTLKGDADLLTDVDPRWLEFIEGVPRLQVLRAPTPYATVVAFNPQRLPKKERAGLVHLLHDDHLRKLAFGDDCVAFEQPDRGPGIVRSSLMPLDVIAFPPLERLALAVRRALADKGGDVRLRDQTGFIADAKSGNFDLATARERISPPVMAVRNWRTRAQNNVFGYSNPRVDAALDAHDWTAAQRALDEDPPAAVICKPVAVTVMDARITNVSQMGFWRNVVQWEIRR
jgi:hypothetical protein